MELIRVEGRVTRHGVVDGVAVCGRPTGSKASLPMPDGEPDCKWCLRKLRVTDVHRAVCVCAKCKQEWPCPEANIDWTGKCSAFSSNGKRCLRRGDYGMRNEAPSGKCRMHYWRDYEALSGDK